MVSLQTSIVDVRPVYSSGTSIEHRSCDDLTEAKLIARTLNAVKKKLIRWPL